MKRASVIRDEAQLMDVAAAATLLGMTDASVRQAVYRGELPARRFGRRRMVFVRSELIAFIRTLPRRMPPPPDAANG